MAVPLINYILNRSFSTILFDKALTIIGGMLLKVAGNIISRSKKITKVERFRLSLQLIGLAIFIYFGSQSTFYVVLLSVPVALLFGPVYCGWMCPRGMFQNIIGSMGKGYSVKDITNLSQKESISRYYIFAM